MWAVILIFGLVCVLGASGSQAGQCEDQTASFDEDTQLVQGFHVNVQDYRATFDSSDAVQKPQHDVFWHLLHPSGKAPTLPRRGRGGTFALYPAVWLPRAKSRKQKRIAKKVAPNCFAIASQNSAKEACPGFSARHCGWCSACRYRQVSAQQRGLPNGCYAREPPFWPTPGQNGMGSTFGVYPAIWEMPNTERRKKCKRRFAKICVDDEDVCVRIDSQQKAKWACPGLNKKFCDWCSACRWRSWAASMKKLPFGCYSREGPWTPDNEDPIQCIKSGAPFCWECKNGICKRKQNKYAIQEDQQ